MTNENCQNLCVWRENMNETIYELWCGINRMILRKSQMAKSINWHRGAKKDKIQKGKRADVGGSSFQNLYVQKINCSEVRHE